MSWVIHPFLFAVFPIIFLFAVNIDLVSAEEIILPILVTLFVAFSLWISLGFILKNKNKSGLIVSLGLFLFFSYGHFYILFESNSELIPHWLLFTIFLIVFIISTYFFIKTKNELKKATTIVNFLALSFFAISMINIGTYYLDTNNFVGPTTLESDKNINASKILGNYPDIYYIILDEYADADILMKYTNYDNQEFISFLEEKGFYIASESYSNYPSTVASIPSTLNMDYIHLKKEEFGISSFNIATEKFLASNSKVMKHLKSKGYTIININSGIHPTKYEGLADIFLCNGKGAHNSEFLPLLFHTSMLNLLNFQFFGSSIREQTLCSFESLTKLDNISEKPKFVFSHINIPHAPYVFGPNGEPIITGSFLSSPVLTWNVEGYINQLQFANKKMKVVVEKLLDVEDPPIIIILSDHGIRHGKITEGPDLDLWKNPSREFLEKRLNNFKAYYFHDKERNFLLENTTNVNTFRIIFNTYFNDNFEILDDKIYGEPNFKDLTEILFPN